LQISGTPARPITAFANRGKAGADLERLRQRKVVLEENTLFDAWDVAACTRNEAVKHVRVKADDTFRHSHYIYIYIYIYFEYMKLAFIFLLAMTLLVVGFCTRLVRLKKKQPTLSHVKNRRDETTGHATALLYTYYPSMVCSAKVLSQALLGSFPRRRQSRTHRGLAI